MKYNAIWVLLFALSSCGMNEDKTKIPTTSIHIIDSVRHYYPIRHKKELYIPYHIVNTGEKPLFLYNIESSGPCITIKDYTTVQIPVGKEGVINVLYKSEGLFGYNKHFITFDANTVPVSRHTVIFDVLVVPDEFGYGDGFDYRYVPEEDEKSAIKEAVNGDETRQGYYTDSSDAKLKSRILNP